MPTCNVKIPCRVCNVIEETMHSHHTTPQAYGGKDSKQVILCPNCHNLIHSHANAVMSYKRSGGKKKIPNFWSTHEKEQAAMPLVQLIVRAAEASTENKSYKMIIEVEAQIYAKLRFIKKEQGLSSLQEALTFCINYTHGRISTQLSDTNKNKLW